MSGAIPPPKWAPGLTAREWRSILTEVSIDVLLSRGWTVEQIARKLDVSVRTATRWKVEKRAPRQAAVTRLVQIATREKKRSVVKKEV